MNKLFGGKQGKMRDTKIENQTYLGQYNHLQKLKIGKTQSMIFKESDSGLFYLSKEERQRRKFDIQTNEEKTVKYTRSFLIDRIKEKTGLQQIRGNLDKVQKIATKLNIPTEIHIKKILEGWQGKVKGMMQVLWECGILDMSMSSKELMRLYSKEFKKDKHTKQNIPGTSMKELVSNLPDFKNEFTLLQYRAAQLGVTINCSPKFHPEIAGEGVEYCWGLGKNTYRRYSVADKRTKSKYIDLVKKCTCPNTVLTKQQVRTFGKRTRRYMLAYHALEKAKEDQTNVQTSAENTNLIHLPEMSSALVEKIIKVYKKPHKNHRNIADSEKRFLRKAASFMKAQN